MGGGPVFGGAGLLVGDIVPFRHRFGPFEIHETSRQVRRPGAAPLALGDRAFDVLMALVRGRGEVVSKREILQAAWPALVVEEGNLHVQISALRKCLGHDSIATIPGRGYRLALELVTEPEAGRAPAPAAGLHARVRPPQRLTPVIGREADVATVVHMLSEHRLVTLVGPGGIGKTSLAQAVAERITALSALDVAWIDLGALGDASLISSALAHGLGLEATARVPLAQQLARALGAQPLLIVLDCAEHLQQAVAQTLDSLCRSTPALRCLVTSQVRLRLDNEAVYALQPLGVPTDADALADAAGRALDVNDAMAFGAIALFATRAQQASHRFGLSADNLPSVIEICRRLHGNPLAIELAAARVPTMGLQMIEAMLDDRFRLLKGGNAGQPLRLQSLRDALAWSYDLLPTTAQTVFRRLSVFQAQFTMAEAVRVAAGGGLDEVLVVDLLADLVDRSLVAAEGFDQPHYHLLESARDFACVLLDEAESQLARGGHLALCLGRVERARAAFETREWPVHVRGLEAALPDLLAALRWSLEQAQDIEAGATLAAGLTGYFIDHQLRDMARHWLEAALAQRERLGPLTQARVLFGMSSLQWHIGHPAQAVAWLDEGISCFERAGERGFEYAVALNERATALLAANRLDAAREQAQQALGIFEAAGQHKREVEALWNIGLATLFRGVPRQAAGYFVRARALALETLGSELVKGHAISHLVGECAYFSGHFDEAASEALQAIAVSEHLGEGDLLARYHAYLALYESACGRWESARTALAEAQRMLERCPPTMWTNNAFDVLACIAFGIEADELGVRWLAHSDAARIDLRLPRRPVWQARLDACLTAARTRHAEPSLLGWQTAGRAMSYVGALALMDRLQSLLCATHRAG